MTNTSNLASVRMTSRLVYTHAHLLMNYRHMFRFTQCFAGFRLSGCSRPPLLLYILLWSIVISRDVVLDSELLTQAHVNKQQAPSHSQRYLRQTHFRDGRPSLPFRGPIPPSPLPFSFPSLSFLIISFPFSPRSGFKSS